MPQSNNNLTGVGGQSVSGFAPGQAPTSSGTISNRPSTTPSNPFSQSRIGGGTTSFDTSSNVTPASSIKSPKSNILPSPTTSSNTPNFSPTFGGGDSSFMDGLKGLMGPGTPGNVDPNAIKFDPSDSRLDNLLPGGGRGVSSAPISDAAYRFQMDPSTGEEYEVDRYGNRKPKSEWKPVRPEPARPWQPGDPQPQAVLMGRPVNNAQAPPRNTTPVNPSSATPQSSGGFGIGIPGIGSINLPNISTPKPGAGGFNIDQDKLFKGIGNVFGPGVGAGLQGLTNVLQDPQGAKNRAQHYLISQAAGTPLTRLTHHLGAFKPVADSVLKGIQNVAQGPDGMANLAQYGTLLAPDLMRGLMHTGPMGMMAMRGLLSGGKPLADLAMLAKPFMRNKQENKQNATV